MNQDPKSLPKLSDSQEPKNLDELLTQLNHKYPELPKGATPAQHRARTQKVIEAILASPFQTEEQKQDLRNQTWQTNHKELLSVISAYVQKKNRMPSVSDLAQETGLSRQTISKHLKEFHQSDGYQLQWQQFRLLSTQVVSQLFKLAMQGDVKAAKVYLDAVGGLPGAEPLPAKQPTTNYIQINNSIKIDQSTFTMLPQAVQQKIAGLVLQGLQTTLTASPQDDQMAIDH